MTVMTLSLKYYINGHGNLRRNTGLRWEYVRRGSLGRGRNISLWTTWTLPRLRNKEKPIGFWESENRTKKAWKLYATSTFARTNYLVMKRLIHHYATANGTYYCFH